MTDLARSDPNEPALDSGPGPANPTAARPLAAQPAQRDGPPAEVLAVWEAEDGRCEACTRAMDRTCAHSVTVAPNSVPRLVCPDCNSQRPDPLTIAVVGPRTAEALAELRMTNAEDSAVWLVEGLRAYGVLLRLDDRRRNYWLPGVGIFMLSMQRPDRPWVGGPLGKLNPHPTIRVKPQSRTRGLPHLPRPDDAGADMRSSNASAPSGAA